MPALRVRGSWRVLARSRPVPDGPYACARSMGFYFTFFNSSIPILRPIKNGEFKSFSMSWWIKCDGIGLLDLISVCSLFSPSAQVFALPMLNSLLNRLLITINVFPNDCESIVSSPTVRSDKCIRLAFGCAMPYIYSHAAANAAQ